MPISFPIYILKEGVELPDEGRYFVVAGNGLFCRQEGPFFDRLVPVDRIGFLKHADTHVNTSLPLVSPITIGRSIMFFRRVFQKMHSESVLLLFVNEETGEFDLECPEQEVDYTGIDYDPTSASKYTGRPGWLRVGSIHSHCDFDASHSGTDRNDEIKFPGLHITLGHVPHDRFSCVASYAFVKERFPTEPLEAIAGLTRDASRYKLQLSDSEAQVLLNTHIDEIEEEWLPRVKKSRDHGFRSCDTWNRRSGRQVIISNHQREVVSPTWPGNRETLPLMDVMDNGGVEPVMVQKTLFDYVPPTVEAAAVEQAPVVQGQPIYPLALPMPTLEEMLNRKGENQWT